MSVQLASNSNSSEGIAEPTIDFYSDRELIASATATADGVASVPVPPATAATTAAMTLVFERDDFYLDGSDDKPGKGGNGRNGTAKSAGPTPERSF